MMLKYLALIAVLGVVSTDSETNGDLESLIKQIFGDQVNKTETTTQSVRTTLNLQPSSTTKKGDTSCTLDNGERGECVPYYLCNSDNAVITDGYQAIDIRLLEKACASYLDTCCRLPDTREEDNPITPAPPKNSLKGCGIRNKNGVGFNIKGAVDGEANYGEFPWMVAIVEMKQAADPEAYVYVGGGSLIHPSVVLTVAHYVAKKEPSTLVLRAGEWDTQTTKELYPYQNRAASSIVVHEKFNPTNAFYDIALIFVTEPFEMAPHVGVVCLPPPNVRVSGGTKCTASGWGKDKFGKAGKYQVILKKIELPVVDRAKCQEELRKTRLGRFFKLHTSFMCAGGEPGIDACKGDGGSPLVCPSEEADRYVQHGIVAWGIGCGQDGVPGVYVDVAHLRTWIDDRVRAKNYDTAEYTLKQ